MNESWFYSISQQEREARKEEVTKFFNIADKNGDGKLTKDEWVEVLQRSGSDVDMARVDKFFNSMDRDYDGRLSLEEFLGEETPIEKLFKLMDRDGDGFVTKKEFQTICKKLSKEQVSLAFAQFDANGDDRLDYREFCIMIQKKEANIKSSSS